MSEYPVDKAGKRLFTVSEIADFLNVTERTIQRWVKKHFPEKMQERKTTYLNEVEITVIKKELERNYSCDNAVAVTTDLEMFRKSVEVFQWMQERLKKTEEKLDEAKEKIAIDAPKVRTYERLVASDDCIEISAAAKVLGYKPLVFFDELRKQGYLFYKTVGTKKVNIPYQDYLNMGIFKVVEVPYTQNDEEKISLKTVITQKGMEYFIRRFAMA